MIFATPRTGRMVRQDGKLVYLPVQGPRLKQIRRRTTNTGLPGVSFVSSRRGPGHRRYDYFYAHVGGNRSVRFNIDTLGREEAWRRAVRARADYESAVMASNAAIVLARSRSARPSGSPLETTTRPSKGSFLSERRAA